MARTDTVTLSDTTWTELTNANATEVTFQVKAGAAYLVVTVGATPPSDLDNAMAYSAGQGEAAIALADLAPGTSGGNRLYALANGYATVYISHA